jgi:transposase InsO family protein
MKNYYPLVGLNTICRLFGKSRQAFYDQNWRTSTHQMQEHLVLKMVQDIRIELPKTGGLKLLYMLKNDFEEHHILMGRDGFFELLRSNGLLIKTRKRFAITTNSNHPYKKWSNLIQTLTPTAKEQLWVSDITYLRTAVGFIYLSLITDAYSKKIVGYHLSQQLKAKGCLIALNKAIASLQSSTQYNLIHHSDRGIQYCCEPYIALLKENNINISMTQSGSPYDNAIAERVNGILKNELQLDKIFDNYSQAVAAVSVAINAYNELRPHMSCGNLTPKQAHQTKTPLIKQWKNKNYCKAKPVIL